jgi:hypothetical protein
VAAAVGGERAGGLRADSARVAGDDRDLAGEIGEIGPVRGVHDLPSCRSGTSARRYVYQPVTNRGQWPSR